MQFNLSHQIQSARDRAGGAVQYQVKRKSKWSRLTDKERKQRTEQMARKAMYTRTPSK